MMKTNFYLKDAFLLLKHFLHLHFSSEKKGFLFAALLVLSVSASAVTDPTVVSPGTMLFDFGKAADTAKWVPWAYGSNVFEIADKPVANEFPKRSLTRSWTKEGNWKGFGATKAEGAISLDGHEYLSFWMLNTGNAIQKCNVELKSVGDYQVNGKNKTVLKAEVLVNIPDSTWGLVTVPVGELLKDSTYKVFNQFLVMPDGNVGEAVNTTYYLSFVYIDVKPAEHISIDYSNRITIDGDLSDWADIESQAIDIPGSGSSIVDASDFSGNVKAVWDQHNLYVNVNITDDMLDVSSPNAWENDALEIAFNMAVDQSYDVTSWKDKDEGKLLVVFGDNKDSIQNASGRKMGWIKVDGDFDLITVETDEGWAVEFKIPFWNIDIEKNFMAETNAQFQMAINMIDRDNGQRKANLSWGGNEWINKTNVDFPTVTLTGTPPSLPEVVSPGTKLFDFGKAADTAKWVPWAYGSNVFEIADKPVANEFPKRSLTRSWTKEGNWKGFGATKAEGAISLDGHEYLSFWMLNTGNAIQKCNVELKSVGDYQVNGKNKTVLKAEVLVNIPDSTWGLVTVPVGELLKDSTYKVFNQFLVMPDGNVGEAVNTTYYMSFVYIDVKPAEDISIDYSSSITIDGELSDWADIESQAIDIPGSGSSIVDASDFSGNVKAVWDQHNLYVNVNITDDMLDVSSPNAWENDALEIAFNMAVDQSYDVTSWKDKDEGKLLILFGDNKDSIQNASGRKMGWINVEGDFDLVTVETDNGWAVEFKIPFWNICVDSIFIAEAGAQFQMAINMIDRDNGKRKGNLSWGGNEWINKTNVDFPTVTLTGTPTIGTTNNIDNVVSNQLSIYPNPVVNGQLFIQSLNNSDTRVEIFSITGQMVYSNQFAVHNNLLHIKLPDVIKSGLYIVRVMSENQSRSQTIVVK